MEAQAITEVGIKKQQLVIAQWMQVPEEIIGILNQELPWRIREWIYLCALDQMPAETLEKMPTWELEKIQRERMEFLQKKFQDIDLLERAMKENQDRLEILAENLNVENLARQVYLSPGYLSVVFKEETGVNLNRYVRDIRMKKSRELLENTSMKISQIAKEVGFSNNSYFCRSFREYFGSTPESCRKGSMSDEEASLSVS